jgi:hypothetical protein
VRHLLPASLILLSACPDRSPPPNPILDLTRPANGPAPRAELVAVDLTSHAAFDELERTLVERQGPDTLIAALAAMAEKADPAKRPADAILLTRLAMLYRDHDGDREGFLEKALDLATLLAKAAPKAPDTLFLQGYIPFAFIGGSDTRDAIIDPTDSRMRQFGEACLNQWRNLVESHPTYAGPRGFTAERLRIAVKTLSAALEESTPEPNAAIADTRPLSGAELTALRELERFASSTDGQRRTLCRDWNVTRPKDASSSLELRLDLECATFEGRIPDAVALISRLDPLDGRAFDTCLAVRRIADRNGVEPTKAALQGSPLVERCKL